ncbi:hypothetical protein [Bradyrhizobium liaoningense]|uniref:hypothetical protein n=1 Tax=Bradyrhizobium liaoningense TaxID=43992 RepID=UPI001BA6643A|nr:hypothetical protein [Bradyrhizobium liaoningense]MBR1034453.1 hypothetical protein [Bradyrhizobium liaoningense]
MTKPKPSKQDTPAAAIVVFGLDKSGKPKAGRFPKQHAATARKAARSLKLAVCDVDRPSLAEIVAKIPTGRVHSTGRTFLPYIKQGLYDELSAAAQPGKLKVAAAKTVHPTKAMDAKKGRSKLFIILGFDESLKPRGARYQDPDEEHLAKLSAEAKLNLYELRSSGSVGLAASLPIGKLPSAGPLSVPEIRQSLYSEVIVDLADETRCRTAGQDPRFATASEGISRKLGVDRDWASRNCAGVARIRLGGGDCRQSQGGHASSPLSRLSEVAAILPPLSRGRSLESRRAVTLS